MIIDSACAEENFFFLADVWVIFLLQHDLHNEKKIVTKIKAFRVSVCQIPVNDWSASFKKKVLLGEWLR